MKNIYIFILVFLALSLSSCSSTFYLATLNSDTSGVKKLENGDFFMEEDSLWVSHSFNGENAPVLITVFNKSHTHGLTIDWSKSALIIDNEAFGYGGNILRKNKTYIPPNSQIHRVPIILDYVNFDNLSDKDFINFPINHSTRGVVNTKRVDYSRFNSPLVMLSGLVAYSDVDETNPIRLESTFYIANIIKAKGIKPKDISTELADRGDLFYIEKPANTDVLEAILGATIIVGVTAASIWLDSEVYDEDHH